jgi:SAM-dependent methyltransferase
MGKFQGMVRAFPDIWEGLVLDVGCRSGQLKGALPNGNARYCGVDLFPPANVVGNLEEGLPFGDASSDTVIALDVLEHTNDIYRAFGELCRVSRTYVLVILPNLYEAKYRMKFLLGWRLSGKYGLPVEPPGDRHRWLFSFREALVFTHALSRRYGFEVVAEGGLIGPRRGLAGGRLMAGLFPNLLSPSYAALLRRKEGTKKGLVTRLAVSKTDVLGRKTIQVG